MYLSGSVVLSVLSLTDRKINLTQSLLLKSSKANNKPYVFVKISQTSQKGGEL